MKMSVTNPEALTKAELDWAFPVVDPGAKPLGGRILVQLRRTKKKTTGAGIILVEETKETEKWNNMVAKVLMIGPLAFKNRDTMQPWPEGSWCEVGDYIRVPKWGGDRWEVKVPGEDDLEDPALFMILNDHEVIATVTGDPLAMKAFL
jgi:co-chaperonin GroES (HSP10)